MFKSMVILTCILAISQLGNVSHALDAVATSTGTYAVSIANEKTIVNGQERDDTNRKKRNVVLLIPVPSSGETDNSQEEEFEEADELIHHGHKTKRCKAPNPLRKARRIPVAKNPQQHFSVSTESSVDDSAENIDDGRSYFRLASIKDAKNILKSILKSRSAKREDNDAIDETVSIPQDKDSISLLTQGAKKSGQRPKKYVCYCIEDNCGAKKTKKPSRPYAIKRPIGPNVLAKSTYSANEENQRNAGLPFTEPQVLGAPNNLHCPPGAVLVEESDYVERSGRKHNPKRRPVKKCPPITPPCDSESQAIGQPTRINIPFSGNRKLNRRVYKVDRKLPFAQKLQSVIEQNKAHGGDPCPEAEAPHDDGIDLQDYYNDRQSDYNQYAEVPLPPNFVYPNPYVIYPQYSQYPQYPQYDDSLVGEPQVPSQPVDQPCDGHQSPQYEATPLGRSFIDIDECIKTFGRNFCIITTTTITSIPENAGNYPDEAEDPAVGSHWDEEMEETSTQLPQGEETTWGYPTSISDTDKFAVTHFQGPESGESAEDDDEDNLHNSDLFSQNRFATMSPPYPVGTTRWYSSDSEHKKIQPTDNFPRVTTQSYGIVGANQKKPTAFDEHDDEDNLHNSDPFSQNRFATMSPTYGVGTTPYYSSHSEHKKIQPTDNIPSVTTQSYGIVGANQKKPTAFDEHRNFIDPNAPLRHNDPNKFDYPIPIDSDESVEPETQDLDDLNDQTVQSEAPITWPSERVTEFPESEKTTTSTNWQGAHRISSPQYLEYTINPTGKHVPPSSTDDTSEEIVEDILPTGGSNSQYGTSQYRYSTQSFHQQQKSNGGEVVEYYTTRPSERVGFTKQHTVHGSADDDDDDEAKQDKSSTSANTVFAKMEEPSVTYRHTISTEDSKEKEFTNSQRITTIYPVIDHEDRAVSTSLRPQSTDNPVDKYSVSPSLNLYYTMQPEKSTEDVASATATITNSNRQNVGNVQSTPINDYSKSGFVSSATSGSNNRYASSFVTDKNTGYDTTPLLGKNEPEEDKFTSLSDTTPSYAEEAKTASFRPQEVAKANTQYDFEERPSTPYYTSRVQPTDINKYSTAEGSSQSHFVGSHGTINDEQTTETSHQQFFESDAPTTENYISTLKDTDYVGNSAETPKNQYTAIHIQNSPSENPEIYSKEYSFDTKATEDVTNRYSGVPSTDWHYTTQSGRNTISYIDRQTTADRSSQGQYVGADHSISSGITSTTVRSDLLDKPASHSGQMYSSATTEGLENGSQRPTETSPKYVYYYIQSERPSVTDNHRTSLEPENLESVHFTENNDYSGEDTTNNYITSQATLGETMTIDDEVVGKFGKHRAGTYHHSTQEPHRFIGTTSEYGNYKEAKRPLGDLEMKYSPTTESLGKSQQPEEMASESNFYSTQSERPLATANHRTSLEPENLESVHFTENNDYSGEDTTNNYITSQATLGETMTTGAEVVGKFGKHREGTYHHSTQEPHRFIGTTSEYGNYKEAKRPLGNSEIMYSPTTESLGKSQQPEEIASESNFYSTQSERPFATDFHRTSIEPANLETTVSTTDDDYSREYTTNNYMTSQPILGETMAGKTEIPQKSHSFITTPSEYRNYGEAKTPFGHSLQPSETTFKSYDFKVDEATKLHPHFEKDGLKKVNDYTVMSSDDSRITDVTNGINYSTDQSMEYTTGQHFANEELSHSGSTGDDELIEETQRYSTVHNDFFTTKPTTEIIEDYTRQSAAKDYKNEDLITSHYATMSPQSGDEITRMIDEVFGNSHDASFSSTPTSATRYLENPSTLSHILKNENIVRDQSSTEDYGDERTMNSNDDSNYFSSEDHHGSTILSQEDITSQRTILGNTQPAYSTLQKLSKPTEMSRIPSAEEIGNTYDASFPSTPISMTHHLKNPSRIPHILKSENMIRDKFTTDVGNNDYSTTDKYSQSILQDDYKSNKDNNDNSFPSNDYRASTAFHQEKSTSPQPVVGNTFPAISTFETDSSAYSDIAHKSTAIDNKLPAITNETPQLTTHHIVGETLTDEISGTTNDHHGDFISNTVSSVQKEYSTPPFARTEVTFSHDNQSNNPGDDSLLNNYRIAQPTDLWTKTSKFEEFTPSYDLLRNALKAMTATDVQTEATTRLSTEKITQLDDFSKRITSSHQFTPTFDKVGDAQDATTTSKDNDEKTTQLVTHNDELQSDENTYTSDHSSQEKSQTTEYSPYPYKSISSATVVGNTLRSQSFPDSQEVTSSSSTTGISLQPHYAGYQTISTIDSPTQSSRTEYTPCTLISSPTVVGNTLSSQSFPESQGVASSSVKYEDSTSSEDDITSKNYESVGTPLQTLSTTTKETADTLRPIHTAESARNSYEKYDTSSSLQPHYTEYQTISTIGSPTQSSRTEYSTYKPISSPTVVGNTLRGQSFPDSQGVTSSSVQYEDSTNSEHDITSKNDDSVGTPLQTVSTTTTETADTLRPIPTAESAYNSYEKYDTSSSTSGISIQPHYTGYQTISTIGSPTQSSRTEYTPCTPISSPTVVGNTLSSQSFPDSQGVASSSVQYEDSTSSEYDITSKNEESVGTPLPTLSTTTTGTADTLRPIPTAESAQNSYEKYDASSSTSGNSLQPHYTEYQTISTISNPTQSSRTEYSTYKPISSPTVVGNTLRSQSFPDSQGVASSSVKYEDSTSSEHDITPKNEESVETPLPTLSTTTTGTTDTLRPIPIAEFAQNSYEKYDASSSTSGISLKPHYTEHQTISTIASPTQSSRTEYSTYKPISSPTVVGNTLRSQSFPDSQGFASSSVKYEDSTSSEDDITSKNYESVGTPLQTLSTTTTESADTLRPIPTAESAQNSYEKYDASSSTSGNSLQPHYTEYQTISTISNPTQSSRTEYSTYKPISSPTVVGNTLRSQSFPDSQGFASSSVKYEDSTSSEDDITSKNYESVGTPLQTLSTTTTESADTLRPIPTVESARNSYEKYDTSSSTSGISLQPHYTEYQTISTIGSSTQSPKTDYTSYKPISSPTVVGNALRTQSFPDSQGVASSSVQYEDSTSSEYDITSKNEESVGTPLQTLSTTTTVTADTLRPIPTAESAFNSYEKYDTSSSTSGISMQPHYNEYQTISTISNPTQSSRTDYTPYKPISTSTVVGNTLSSQSVPNPEDVTSSSVQYEDSTNSEHNITSKNEESVGTPRLTLSTTTTETADTLRPIPTAESTYNSYEKYDTSSSTSGVSLQPHYTEYQTLSTIGSATQSPRTEYTPCTPISSPTVVGNTLRSQSFPDSQGVTSSSVKYEDSTSSVHDITSNNEDSVGKLLQTLSTTTTETADTLRPIPAGESAQNSYEKYDASSSTSRISMQPHYNEYQTISTISNPTQSSTTDYTLYKPISTSTVFENALVSQSVPNPKDVTSSSVEYKDSTSSEYDLTSKNKESVGTALHTITTAEPTDTSRTIATTVSTSNIYDKYDAFSSTNGIASQPHYTAYQTVPTNDNPTETPRTESSLYKTSSSATLVGNALASASLAGGTSSSVGYEDSKSSEHYSTPMNKESVGTVLHTYTATATKPVEKFTTIFEDESASYDAPSSTIGLELHPHYTSYQTTPASDSTEEVLRDNHISDNDRNLLRTTVQKVVNDLISPKTNDADNGAKTPETVGAPNRLPILKNLFSLPEVKEMAVNTVKGLITAASGVPQDSSLGRLEDHVIESVLNKVVNDLIPGDTTTSSSMDVDEHRYENGHWTVVPATLAPNKENVGLKPDDKVSSTIQDILGRPGIGLGGAKLPGVQNIIVRAVENALSKAKHVIDHSVIWDTLNSIIARAEDVAKSSHAPVFTTKSLPKAPGIKTPGASMKNLPVIPITEHVFKDGQWSEKQTILGNTRKNAEPSLSQQQHISATTAGSDNNDLRTSTTSYGTSIIDAKESDYTTKALDYALLGESDENPDETTLKQVMGTTDDIPDETTIETVGGTSSNRNIDVKADLEKSPIEYYSPHDRILTYIKNHQTSAGKAPTTLSSLNTEKITEYYSPSAEMESNKLPMTTIDGSDEFQHSTTSDSDEVSTGSTEEPKLSPTKKTKTCKCVDEEEKKSSDNKVGSSQGNSSQELKSVTPVAEKENDSYLPTTIHHWDAEDGEDADYTTEEFIGEKNPQMTPNSSSDSETEISSTESREFSSTIHHLDVTEDNDYTTEEYISNEGLSAEETTSESSENVGNTQLPSSQSTENYFYEDEESKEDVTPENIEEVNKSTTDNSKMNVNEKLSSTMKTSDSTAYFDIASKVPEAESPGNVDRSLATANVLKTTISGEDRVGITRGDESTTQAFDQKLPKLPKYDDATLEATTLSRGLVGAAKRPEGSEVIQENLKGSLNFVTPKWDPTYFGKISPSNRANLDSDKISDLANTDLFYVGDGVKIPLTIRRMPDGSYALSISEKICESFVNRKCPCCVPKEGDIIEEKRQLDDPEDAEYETASRENSYDAGSIEPTESSIYANKSKKRYVRSTSGSDVIVTSASPVENFVRKYNLTLNLENARLPAESLITIKEKAEEMKNTKKIKFSKSSGDAKILNLFDNNNMIRRDDSEEETPITKDNSEMISKESNTIRRSEFTYDSDTDSFIHSLVNIRDAPENKRAEIILNALDGLINSAAAKNTGPTGGRNVEIIDEDSTEDQNSSDYDLNEVENEMARYGYQKDNPILERIRYIKEYQQGHGRYKYQQNIDRHARGKMNILKTVLHWLREVFLETKVNGKD